MKLRVEQLNPTIGDIDGNVKLIIDALSEAEKEGVELLILPEMILTGYPVQDLLESESFRHYCYQANEKIVRRVGDTALLFGSLTDNPSPSGRKMYNSALLCRRGELIGQANKSLLPTYDIFDDLRYFEPSRTIECLELRGIKLGVTICEDIWYNENEVQYHYYQVNPAAELKARGARMIVNISASPFTKNKHENRLEMLRKHAGSLGLPLFYSNQTGVQGEIVFDGDTMVMDARGELKAVTEPFEPGYADVLWDPDTGDIETVGGTYRAGGRDAGTGIDVGPDPAGERDAGPERAVKTPGGHEDNRDSPAGGSEGADMDIAENELGRPDSAAGFRTLQKPPGSESGEISPGPDSGEGLIFFARPSDMYDNPRIFKAMLTGIRDYLGKTGISRQVVLGLSGGIDSSLVAVLAAEALGGENVTALMMPGDFSSTGSVRDSEKLAENLGINIRNVPISNLFSSYQEALEPLFEGTGFGVAEENLQSRIRGALLMAYSNKFGPMLLTTGNKSELAVGYATLYGDMNGGLNPIGDLYKTEVFQLCRWLNSEYYRKEIIPEEILDKPPSAELRPDQKDSDSLPEYEILDDILWRYIDLQQGVEKITAGGGHDKDVVRNIVKMVDVNEFKRFQAPPILKLSSKSFGIGRRWPLVQSWTGHDS